jgi:ribonuclease HII
VDGTLAAMTTAVPKLRPSLRSRAPGTAHERQRWSLGEETVVGIDEVGRGAWAGPLTVGAVVIPRATRLYKVRDSKMLTEPEREAMYGRITAWADAWAVGHASHDECDRLGMSDAQRLATDRAISGLGVRPDHALVDGRWDFVATIPTTTIVKGDAHSLSIAAASIIAKVTRDRILRDLATAYPWWWFDANKGYPCPRHKAALQALGPSAIHRRSWAFMAPLVWSGIDGCGVEPDLTLF